MAPPAGGLDFMRKRKRIDNPDDDDETDRKRAAGNIQILWEKRSGSMGVVTIALKHGSDNGVPKTSPVRLDEAGEHKKAARL